jgi:hypothetical protein
VSGEVRESEAAVGARSNATRLIGERTTLLCKSVSASTVCADDVAVAVADCDIVNLFFFFLSKAGKKTQRFFFFSFVL